MKKIIGIIFSYDRAMQLDGVLRSLFLHCKDIDLLKIDVLYKTSDNHHASQYQELATEYSGQVAFKHQQNFRRDLLSTLNPYKKGGAGEYIYSFLETIGGNGFTLGSPLDRVWRRTFERACISLIKLFIPFGVDEMQVLFLVDDNIFVHDFSIIDAVNVIREQNDLIGFSLRLGENITHCYMNNRPQNLPIFIPLNEQVFKFDWTSSEQDFGYPVEVSSSIYRLKDILPIIAGTCFENPNELEERMAYHAKSFRRTHPHLGCYQRSVAFCNPVNKVQTIIPNRTGKNAQYGANELADSFTKGERILVEAYDGFVPNACHQEVELIFERREDPKI
jgi:hypothetical protein